MKVKVEPETEIHYEIESDYGWLVGTYLPNRASEHFWNIFAQHVDHKQEPDYVDKTAQFEPYMKYAEEMLERFAKREFENALKNLVLKIETQTLIAVDGLKPKEATKQIDRLAEQIRKEVKVSMNAPKRGGARKELERPFFTTDEERIKYAETVNSLRPLWGYITRYFKQHYYDENCKEQIKLDAMFQNYSQFCESVPDKLLIKIYRREDSFNLSNRMKFEVSPLGLSLEHARFELGIGSYAAETLKKRYEEGKKLLKILTRQS